MLKFKHLGFAVTSMGILLAVPAMAQSDPMPAQQTVAQPAPALGLKLDPDGGSGPDKTKFRIVSKKEQQQEMEAIRQQRAAAQPTQMQPTPSQAVPPQAATTTNGLTLRPDGGSGPDKTRFRIVSKQEAEKQQGQLQRSGGNSMSSDGTGGGENSSGN